MQKTSLASEVFICRVQNLYDSFASYVQWCHPRTLSDGELQCGKSELCLGPSGTSVLLCYVSMNDLDPLIKYTRHVFIEF